MSALMYAALHIKPVESNKQCNWRGCLGTASYELVLFEDDNESDDNMTGTYCTPHLLNAVEREL